MYCASCHFVYWGPNEPKRYILMRVLKIQKTNWTEITQKARQHWILPRLCIFLLIPLIALISTTLMYSGGVPEIIATKSGSNFIIYLSLMLSEDDVLTRYGIFFIFVLIFIHAIEGINAIIKDYIHNIYTEYLIGTLLKCINIGSLKYVYVFLLL